MRGILKVVKKILKQREGGKAMITLSARAKEEIAKFLADKPEPLGLRLYVAGFG